MKKAGNKASIDALLRRKVSIEVAGISLELQSPTVEQHLEMLDAKEEFRELNKNRDESEKEVMINMFDAAILIKTCLVDVDDIAVVYELIERLGKEGSNVIDRCLLLYQSSSSLNQKEIKKGYEKRQKEKEEREAKNKVTEEEIQEANDRDRTVPFSSPESSG